ncbi:hypothetical protein F5Y08DRAFT_335477 [Xylaria arbuscula]|nr:hypothetical protein F5Y08DRAFT_335477 [Xylaria arbuscula]
MGHQEASPPRQRQRVPHHRRHRHRRSHRSPLRPTNHGHLLHLGNSKRQPHVPNSRAIVESWLEQLTAPAPSPTTRLTSPPSPESQNQLVHHGKRPRSQHSYGSPRRHHPRRADQLWRPHHIPPTQAASSRRLPLPADSPQKAKAYERDSGDSSLISSLAFCREPQEWNSTRTTSQYGEISCFERLDETKGDTINASSPVSHVALEVSTFEKRPRRKTRPDKYDTRKVKSQETKATGRSERNKRAPKPRKGKHVAPGKNVMRDFTSEAVTSDRITVHPNLKPGLFDNKRMPKERPIADLSFSEMPFPKQPEHGISHQKGLSNSRVKERRRESREFEQISSFFLPVGVESKRRKPTSDELKDIETSRDEGPSRREYFTSPIPPTIPTQSDCQNCVLPINGSGSIPDVTSNSLDCHTTSSKTTYFTWSTSQQSPQSKNRVVNTSPEPKRKVTRSVTPENIREALAATGVYKKTKTRLRDDIDPRKHTSIAVYEPSPTHNVVGVHGDASEADQLALNGESTTETSFTNGKVAEKAKLARLKQRWEAILPPGWKSRGSSEDEQPPLNEHRPEMLSETPAEDCHPNRQESLHFDRGKTNGELPSAHRNCHNGDSNLNTGGYFIGNGHIPLYLEKKCISNDVDTLDEDQATTTSRDAMPPPPVPRHRSNVMRIANPVSECGIGSSMSTKTSQALKTQGQHPESNQSTYMGPYVVAGDHCELNGQSEKLIQSVDSVSWLPNATASSITTCNRGHTLSRLSMRSPIYDDQDKKMDSQRIARPTSPTEIGMNETMADFIARIEHEVDEQTAVYEQHPELPTEDPASSIYQAVSTYDIRNQHLVVPDELLRAYDHIPTGVIDELGFQHVFETSSNFNDHNLAACTEDNSARFRTGDRSIDNADEFLEISEFWRPNRFSQF